ncbi:LysR family transcriptional regulator [Nonomuraea terrae]|uniref:LysR family transcriptional regulator n=1 Tax=Nonomuraea terrae TaxID=2530383 RepID=UPI00378B26DF
MAVDGEGSVPAAGDRLGTQSAVSHALRAAERETETVLFDRGAAAPGPLRRGRRRSVHARQILR